MGRKFILLMMLCPLLLSGCWNYTEIEDMVIVMGFAIDRGEDSEYEVMVEAIQVQGGGQEAQFSPVLYTSKGNTIFQAVRNSILRSSQRLFWSHATVVIISEEVARDGVLPVLDWIHRDAEIRSDIWVVVAKGDNAREILRGETDFTDNVSLHIAQANEDHANEPRFYPDQLWGFLERLSSVGISPVASTVSLFEEVDRKIPEVHGTAVFRRDKMVGWLDGNESIVFSYTQPRPVNGLIVTVVEVEGDIGDVTFEIWDVVSNLKPTVQGDAVTLAIDMRVAAGIAEANNITPSHCRADVIDTLERHLADHIERDLRTLIAKAQGEIGTDFFGFGAAIKRSEPEIWRKMENDWEEHFRKLDVTVSVKTNIRGSALLYDTITIRD